jgi:glycosyltransferase involved in cell wall biosynthesis
MRIAQVSTVGTPVLAQGADSIESLVWLLSREFCRLGHDVTVFAAAGSVLSGGRLVATLPGTYGHGGAPGDWQLCEGINLARAIERSGEFDVIHHHAYLWGLPLERLSRAPMVHTLHVTPYDDQARLREFYPDACVTAISEFQWSAFPHLQQPAVIPHGIDAEQFTLREKPGNYLLFLGRFIPQKGPLEAIEVARRLGLPIILAGRENDYFREHVLPLVDGKSVRYGGFVQGKQRDELIGGASALLYPVQAAEPFGLVLIESMMCGAPVAALRQGAVPEVVAEGVTGFVVDSLNDLDGAVQRAMRLDRSRVRAHAEARFSARRMALDYLKVYERLLKGDTCRRSS